MKSLAGLTHRERLQLMRFVTAAVWADLEVNPSEKTFLLNLALRLGLPKEEMDQVEEWLEKPPPIEEVDPFQIPPAHRQLFLEAMDEAMRSDHVVDAPEKDSMRLLRQLLE